MVLIARCGAGAPARSSWPSQPHTRQDKGEKCQGLIWGAHRGNLGWGFSPYHAGLGFSTASELPLYLGGYGSVFPGFLSNFFSFFFFFEAKQEHVCDLIFFLGSVLLLKIAAFLERAAPPLPAG